jgi:3,5-dihydroxyphenylacetyl-CoA synthase
MTSTTPGKSILKAISADLTSPARLSRNGLRAGSARIAGLALADPETSFTQEQVLDLLGLKDDEFAQRIFSRCGVRTRRLRLSEELLATTIQGRTLAIEEHLFGDTVRAIDALEIDPAQIGVVISSSLFSLGGPTLAHRVVDHYEMDAATDKYHVLGVGCASAVPLVRLASQALREHPGKRALVVAAESMTGILMGASEDDERSKTVGSAIFGDGCAVALVELDGAPAGSGDRSGPAVLASKVHQIAGTLDAVRMQLTGDDSYLHMVRELPDLAGAGLLELVGDFLAAHAIEREAIDHWLIHPGGRRIIESVQEALCLSDEQVSVSFKVLADNGNVGTPSIFYVLQRAIEQRDPGPGEHGLMVTIGPGVTVGLMLLRW